MPSTTTLTSIRVTRLHQGPSTRASITRTDNEPIRPRAAGLLIGIECSRIRDSFWMYLISLVTTRIGVELAVVRRKLPDHVVVGLQLYSARTFHVTLSPQIYKSGQGPLKTSSTPNAIQTTTKDIGYYATRSPNLSKSLCSLHHQVPEQSIPTYNPTAKGIPEQAWR